MGFMSNKKNEEKVDGNQQDWKLKGFRMYLNEYGQEKGTYSATVEYKNRKEEEFTIKLNEEEARKVFEIIKASLANTAIEFVERLKKSL